MMKSIFKLDSVALVLAVMMSAAAVAGCGNSGPVTFAEGKMPASMPGDFPVPAGAVIGSTLVDRTNNRTEVELRLRGDLATVVQSITMGLVGAGYVVDRSEGNATGWSIEFSRETLRGSVVVQPYDASISQVVVRVNRS
jgi:predicted small lipoprotein YifL